MNADTDPEREADAPVLHNGDAAEDASAYARLRAELAAHYGVSGPYEAILLDRVTSLAWPWRGFPRSSGGC